MAYHERNEGRETVLEIGMPCPHCGATVFDYMYDGYWNDGDWQCTFCWQDLTPYWALKQTVWYESGISELSDIHDEEDNPSLSSKTSAVFDDWMTDDIYHVKAPDDLDPSSCFRCDLDWPDCSCGPDTVLPEDVHHLTTNWGLRSGGMYKVDAVDNIDCYSCVHFNQPTCPAYRAWVLKLIEDQELPPPIIPCYYFEGENLKPEFEKKILEAVKDHLNEIDLESYL